jgi:ATP-dependent RNA helicase RhlE
MLKNPVEIEVCARNKAAEKVEQCVYLVESLQKRHLLAHLIKKESWFQVLVFVKTKHGANRLSEQLAKTGISAMAIHGNKSQSARTRALDSFKKGSIQALIATDIAARGLDLENLEHVVNFELPNVPEDYVHRIGRTGRAGKSGRAISLVSQGEKGLLAQIERLLKNRIPVATAEDFKPVDQPVQKDSGDDRQTRVKRFVNDGRGNSGTKRPASRGSSGKKPAQNRNSRQSA